MAVTRSSSKPEQAHIEDFPTTEDSSKQAPASKRFVKSSDKNSGDTKSTSKRKATSLSTIPQPPAKKAKSDAPFYPKQGHFSPDNTSQIEKPIIINRSPVLHLWSAVVASFVHPELSWQACLNIGSAISTLCAVSKGKATGMIETPDSTAPEQAEHRDEKNKAETGAKRVEVMGFKLPLRDDAVILSGKPRTVKEGNLIGKYGGEETYSRVKEVMIAPARSAWEGDWSSFDERAFKMYEEFRPSVPKGGRGWGRKGELNLAEAGSFIRDK